MKRAVNIIITVIGWLMAVLCALGTFGGIATIVQTSSPDTDDVLLTIALIVGMVLGILIILRNKIFQHVGKTPAQVDGEPQTQPAAQAQPAQFSGNGTEMAATKAYSIAISVLMLATVFLVFVGRSEISAGGLTVSYKYIDALLPAARSSFRWTTTVYMWVLLLCGVLACVFSWMKPKWAAVLTLAFCLCPTIWHIAASAINHYSIFDMAGIWEWLMFLLPLVATVFSVLLLLARNKQA